MNKKYIKFVIILFILLCVLHPLYSTSLFNAQNIASNYASNNEALDVYMQPSISCKTEFYYVIPIVNSSKDVSFFVPVSVKSGKVYLSKNKEDNLKLAKTAYILRSLYQSSNKNYLSRQLLDKIDREITILDSKKIKLEGIIASNYSPEVTNKTKITKLKIENLINLLSKLHTNLLDLLKDQQTFLQSPSCNDLDSFIAKFTDSFEGYNDLTSFSLDYKDSINDITKITFADQSVDETNKKWILNNITAPLNLNSEINYIYETLSSTYSFYLNISSIASNSSDDRGIGLFVNNFVSKKEYVSFKSLLYDYDEDLKDYDNLDVAINLILDNDHRIYWNMQDNVESLSNNYAEIKNKENKGEYSTAISKIYKAKADVLIILKGGFKEYETTNNNYLYYLAILFLILIIIFVFKKYKHSKHKFHIKKKEVKRKDNKKDPKSLNDLLKYKDPFN